MAASMPPSTSIFRRRPVICARLRSWLGSGFRSFFGRRLRRKAEFRHEIYHADITPAPLREMATFWWKCSVDYFDSPGLEKLGHWNKIAVRRHQNRNVIRIRPGEANHVGHNARIYAFLLCAAQVSTALLAMGCLRLADRTFWITSLPLALQQNHVSARHFVQHVGHPVLELGILRLGRII